MFNIIKKLLPYPWSRTPAPPPAVLFKKFQNILESNNHILGLMADMGDKLGGEYVFDRRYIEDAVEKVCDHVSRLITGFNIVTQKKNIDLLRSFERVSQTIKTELSGNHFLPSGNLVLPLCDLSSEMTDLAGDKMAKLGDIHNRLGLATPDGFVITTQAFFEFMNQKGLLKKAEQAAAHWDANDTATLENLADEMQESIMNTPVPPHLAEQIKAQANALTKRVKLSKLYVALRSSAWGEGEETSFSGQYESLLNTDTDLLIDNYRRIVASMYSFKAWSYRLRKGYHEQETAMAVGCQVMVESRIGGVLHTYAPNVGDEAMVANAMWGLCAPVVEGNRSTDMVILNRTSPYTLRTQTIAHKPQRLVPVPDGGVAWEETPAELQHIPCLTARQLQTLAQTSMSIEHFYKRPQEIEWTYDVTGKLLILQTRPLRSREDSSTSELLLSEAARDAEILLSDKGIVVQRGVSIGKIFQVENDTDLKDFPYGAILVSRYTSPRFSSIMHKTRGIITDVGSSTDHMSSLVREYRIPTIVDTEVATVMLSTGDEVTLDATQNIVYRGNISAIENLELSGEEVFEDFYEYRLLRRLLKHISPLNILECQDENLTPAKCRTLHDITHYIHEKAVEELIHLSEKKAAQCLFAPKRLVANIPLGLMVIDAGNGMHCLPDCRVVTQDQIASLPLRDFLNGLDKSGMWSTQPVSVNLGCFMSSLTRTFPSSLAGPNEVGRNLAVVMENYMHISMRLGYHFTIIDASVSDIINNNSIYFRFLGGVTEFVRRSRRAKFIANILEYYDFRVEVHGDLVVGRVKKLSLARMSERVKILGGLVGYTRQLDALMHTDKDVIKHAQQFIAAMHNVTGGIQ